MLEFIALIATVTIVYSYALFPLLVFVRGRFFGQPWRQSNITPTVDVLIVCHNEAADIGSKLKNLLAADYPADGLRLIVASDGSDDETERIVRDIKDPRVSLLCFPRRGKIPALNDAVEHARGELLVFSDANSQFAPNALRNMVRHFADPSVGGVAGNQVYRGSAGNGAAASGERSYWNYDRLLKVAESRCGNTISATGAIYAIRRSLFRTVPSGVTDDFTISTGVIEQGFRLVLDADAIAWEPVAGKNRAEFYRKVRVMTRGFRAVWVRRKLLNPFRYGFYALQLASHKLLRRLVIIPLLVLLAITPWCWQAGGWLSVLAVAQWIIYSLAAAGFLLGGTQLGRSRPLAIPAYFCLVNVAALVAAVNFVRGRKIEFWDSHRSPDGDQAATLAKAA